VQVEGVLGMAQRLGVAALPLEQPGERVAALGVAHAGCRAELEGSDRRGAAERTRSYAGC
jgi:hypothetical protein